MAKLLEQVGIRPDISLGNLLSIATMLVTMFAAIWAFSGRVSNIERDLANEIKVATEGRATQRPKIEANANAVAVQDERLDRLSAALEDNQKVITELTKATNDLRVLVAVLAAKTHTDGAATGLKEP